MGTCGPFTYSAEQSGGASLPSMLSFDSSDYTFSVDETLITTSATYIIEITGVLPSPIPYSTTTFTLII